MTFGQVYSCHFGLSLHWLHAVLGEDVSAVL